MSIQELVPSKDICEQLAAAGFPQETCFYWVDAIRNYQATGERFENDEHFVLRAPYNYMKTMSEKEKFAAPTAEEIGKLLPEYVGEDWFLEMYKDASNSAGEEWYLVRYVDHDGLGGASIKVGFNEPREVVARAKMYLYLKSNNLI